MDKKARNTLYGREFRAKRPNYFREYYQKQRQRVTTVWLMLTEEELALIETTRPPKLSRSRYIATLLAKALQDFHENPFGIWAEHGQGSGKIRICSSISRKMDEQILSMKKEGQSKTGIMSELIIHWLNKKDSRSRGGRESKSQSPLTHHTGGKKRCDKAMNN